MPSDRRVEGNNMDAVRATSSSQTIVSPLPVQEPRPAAGTVEKRAVQQSSAGSGRNSTEGRPTLNLQPPVVQLIRDFVEHAADILDGMIRDEPGLNSAEQADGATGEQVDVYA